MFKDIGDGVQMPVLGLGGWQVDEGDETENAVERALEARYRRVDTAQLYRNERNVGAAIRRSGLPREEIFCNDQVAADSAERRFRARSEPRMARDDL